MDDHVHSASELGTDHFERQTDAGHQREHLDPVERVSGRTGMHGRERAVMTGVQGGQQVERLRSTHLADHDAIGPHPQSVLQQVPDRHLAAALDARRPRFQPDNMRLAEVEFGCVFDRDDPLGRDR